MLLDWCNIFETGGIFIDKHGIFTPEPHNIFWHLPSRKIKSLMKNFPIYLGPPLQKSFIRTKSVGEFQRK
jgi:hypothetical protein